MGNRYGTLIETLDFDMIVGYSQGAAIALRAHENYFHRKGFEPITWLFGEPPSIKKPSAKLLKRFTKVVSIYNYNDIVFHAPKMLGYKHVGRQVKTRFTVNKKDRLAILFTLAIRSYTCTI